MAGMYRIGPSDLFTPGDLAADARVLNDQINNLDDQNWDAISEATFEAWLSFVSEWRGFYSSHFGGFFTNLTTAINDSNRDQLIQFENRFAGFATQYKVESGNNVPDVVAPSTGAQDTLGAHIMDQLQPLIPQFNIKSVLIVAGIGAAVIGVVIFRRPLMNLFSKGVG